MSGVWFASAWLEWKHTATRPFWNHVDTPSFKYTQYTPALFKVAPCNSCVFAPRKELQSRATLTTLALSLFCNPCALCTKFISNWKSCKINQVAVTQRSRLSVPERLASHAVNISCHHTMRKRAAKRDGSSAGRDVQKSAGVHRKQGTPWVSQLTLATYRCTFRVASWNFKVENAETIMSVRWSCRIGCYYCDL